MRIRKNERVSIDEHQIRGVNVVINYESALGVQPDQVNVNGNYSSGGIQASMYRSYKPDGTCVPAIGDPMGPFDSTFETELSALVAVVFAHYSDPEALIPA